MNILFVSSSLNYGGAEKMLCFVAEELCRRNHRVAIVNLNIVPNTNGYKREINPCINVYTLEISNRFKNIKQINAIIKIAKKENSEIIVGFTERPNFYSKIASLVLRIPSIMSERGDPNRTNVGVGVKNKIVLWFINQSAGGVFQTDGAKDFYGEKLQNNGTVIPNPIFCSKESCINGSNSKRKTVVSVGRLDNTQKRYDVMLGAFCMFHNIHPEYSLRIFGKGDDEQLIIDMIDKFNLMDSVQLMGLSSNPMKDIQEDGIFLITSDYEGISNALLEAMAVGLPCVSTDSTPGGARMLIKNYVNGILTPIEDEQSICDALCYFAENKEEAKKCGQEAKKVLFRFSPDLIVDMWESYLISVKNIYQKRTGTIE